MPSITAIAVPPVTAPVTNPSGSVGAGVGPLTSQQAPEVATTTARTATPGAELERRSFPYVGNIDPIIQTELNSRGSRPRKTHAVWMRMLSGAGDGKVIAGGEMGGNAFGGTLTNPQSFTERYSGNTYRPVAGVTSISVEPKSRDLGAIRKVTIKWNCWSLDDLHRLAPYFLNPGMSVMVEFGWSEPESFQQMFPLVPAEIAKLRFPGTGQDLLRAKIQASKGKYDAVLGITTNFGWSLNADGGFECMTEVMSPGEIMLGVNLDFETTEVGPDNDTGQGEVPEETLTIRKFFTEQIGEYLKGTETVTSMIQYPNYAAEKYTSAGLVTDCQMLTWDHLEFIVNKFIALRGSGNDTAISKFNSSHTKLKWHKDLRSVNVIDCVIPNAHDGVTGILPDSEFEVSHGTSVKTYRMGGLWINVALIVEAFSEQSNIRDAIDIMLGRIETAASSFWDLKILSDEQSGELKIIDNNCSGDKPVKDFVKDDNLFTLVTHGPSCIVRDISMESDVSNETMITIMYSKADTNRIKNNTTDVQAVIFNYGLKDAIGEIIAANNPVAPVGAGNVNTVDTPVTGDGQDETTLWGRTKRVAKDWFTINGGLQAVEAAKQGYTTMLAAIGSVLDANKELLEPYQASKLDVRNLTAESVEIVGENPPNSDIITNVKFEATLDGISGILIGDCLAITNVPDEYQRCGVFQVMGVQYEISKDDWTTRLSGRFRTADINTVRSAIDAIRGTGLVAAAAKPGTAWTRGPLVFGQNITDALSALETQMLPGGVTGVVNPSGAYLLYNYTGTPITSGAGIIAHHGNRAGQSTYGGVIGGRRVLASGHYVVDLTMNKDGTSSCPVPAPASGVVTLSVDPYPGQNRGAGNSIVLEADGGVRWRFLHFSSFSCNQGRIERGQAMGIQGTTGSSTGIHSHIEIRAAGLNDECQKLHAYLDSLLSGSYENTNAGATGSGTESDVIWLARCILTEAEGQPGSMNNVGWVIRNRVDTSFYGVGYQGVILRRKQFSAFNTVSGEASATNRPKSPKGREAMTLGRGSIPLLMSAGAWMQALRVAQEVINAPSSANPFRAYPISRDSPERVRHFYSPPVNPTWRDDDKKVPVGDPKFNFFWSIA